MSKFTICLFFLPPFMVSIKGPRSALTDFIEEHDIKIVKREKIEEVVVQQEKPAKKRKTIKKLQPSEITNIEKRSKKLEDIVLDSIYDTYKQFEMNDSQLELFSKYLSRERKINNETFRYLIDSCNNKLCIYDCSRIGNDQYYIDKKLDTLELHYCGQLRQDTLNSILRKQNKLKRLVITGAYLLDSFVPPKSVKYLDVSNCSRLSDKFVNQLNKTCKKLDTLKLSYCYGLTEKCKLKIEIENLYICETNLSFLSIKTMKKLYSMKSLSVRKCPNILCEDLNDDVDIEKFKSLEFLDLEGIATLTDVVFAEKLKYLNLAYCYNINIDSLCNCKDIEYLNLSKIDVTKEKLDVIAELKQLKILNISWTEALTDDILENIITSCKYLEKIYVFGCFNLTTRIGELAWSNKCKIEIIGNPAETRYLLNC